MRILGFYRPVFSLLASLGHLNESCIEALKNVTLRAWAEETQENLLKQLGKPEHYTTVSRFKLYYLL